MTVRVGLKWLAHGAGLPLPRQQTAGAAGLDLAAAIGVDETVTIAPGDYAMVPTGLVIALPLVAARVYAIVPSLLLSVPLALWTSRRHRVHGSTDLADRDAVQLGE